MARYGVGVIGCGNISGIYFQNCKRFSNLELVACADMDLERAKSKAQEYDIPKGLSVEDLLNDPDVQIVINLTIPKAHAVVNIAALEHGKHVYTEKPLGITRAEGKQTMDLARNKGLLVGGAPDTFLGAGLQTCRKLIDEGAIGRPVSATAFMMGHGPENWHPSPEFFYKVGGGPMLDMGPYYLTALVSLLGGVKRLAGLTSISMAERLIGSEPLKGQRIVVDTPTHLTGVLEFAEGAVGTIITSFDTWRANVPLLEIHGTEGSLSLPDPNSFGGPVKVFSPKANEWEEVPLAFGYEENSRGLGVADLASAHASGRPVRASGDLCYHVLDVMQSFQESSEGNKFITLTSGVERPKAMPDESFSFAEKEAAVV
jgi:predicted dehydrogenase